MQDGDYLARNDAERERLAALLARLDEAAFARPLGDGWTVSAALGHLAFWDRFVLARWELAARSGDGVPPLVGDILLDLINAAGLPGWRALPPDEAAREALEAAAAIDARVAQLGPAQVEAVLASDRPSLLDRSVHRRPHLEAIERVLAG